MEAEREDGELSGSDSNGCDDVNVYNPIVRPNANVCRPRNVCPSIPSSDDESYSSDSESDFMCRPKKQKIHSSQMEIERNGAMKSDTTRKKNNIWANVLQEEELTLEIGGVGLKKLKGDRNVENYHYEEAQKLHKANKDEINIFEEEETEESTQKRLMRKRRFYDNSEELKRRKKLSKPRYLADINAEPEWDNEQLGGAIADALFEQKPELIVKVVEVLGPKKALELYTKTQEVEEEGGMMILNGSRRRTSGGVYLQVLKGWEGVEKEHVALIFCEDTKETQMWRKRKRVNRRRNKHISGGGGVGVGVEVEVGGGGGVGGEKCEEDGLPLKGLFSEDPGGTKCPGSTPVTSPTASDEDEDGELSPNSRMKGSKSHFLPLKEVCEKVASDISLRERLSEGGITAEAAEEEEEAAAEESLKHEEAAEESPKHEEMETC